MSPPTGNYLKPARRVTVPAVVFTIVVETENIPSRNTEVYTESVFKSAVATVTKRRRGKWTLPKVIETHDVDALRLWVEENADHKRRNYIVCPVASQVLTLTRWWHHVEKCGARFESGSNDLSSSEGPVEADCGYRVRRCILRERPDIFDYSFDSRRYIWLSGSQFIDSSIDSIASAIGYGNSDGLFGLTEQPADGYSTLDIALIWSQLFCHLSNWWGEVATAPFGLTVGGLAMGILRTHIQPKSISTHKDTYGHAIERAACYGGRASLWFVGTVGNAPVLPIYGTPDDRRRNLSRLAGPIRLLDCRSMYPYLLANRVFPCKIAGRIGELCGRDLQSLCGHYGVIASVTLRAKKAEYPKREKNRLIYPTGYFQTVLTGPEILSIQAPDELICCHDGVKYTMGTPFKKAAQVLLDMRVTARESGNQCWEMFAKSVGNNLGGKLAQRKSLQRPRSDIAAERQWGEWIVRVHGEERAKRFRSYAGLVYETVRDEGGYGPYTPSFAYLTAYGRLYMRAMRELLPAESIVSQDTDGIWVVGDDAYNILVQKGLFGDSPGMLQVKEESDNATFMSPRHYFTDMGWTLAGFTSKQLDVQTMQVFDSHIQNPVTIGARSAPTTLIRRSRLSVLSLEHGGSAITPYGWVNPIYYPDPKS